MIILNNQKKQQFKEEAQELEAMGLTYKQYEFLKEKGTDLLMAFEKDFQNNLELNTQQSVALNYLLVNAVLIMRNTIEYGYSLIVNTPPPEVCQNPKLFKEFKECRINLYIGLKEDFINKKS